MSDMALVGFGLNAQAMEFSEAARAIYPLSPAQESRAEQILIAYRNMKDLNGLLILADAPDASLLRQLVRNIYHENGDAKTIEETARF